MPVLQDISGVPLTSSCQEAVDSFNKGLMAFVTLRESPLPWFQQALEKDQEFVMGHSMMGFLLLFDLNPPSDPRVAAHLKAVEKAVESFSLNPREMAYVRVLQVYASGDLLKATESLTTMLIDFPHDALALRMLHVSFLFLSEFERLRDALAWVLTFWTEDMHLYPFVMALYGFAVEECNERGKAEKIIKHVLDLNRETPFAYHAMSHVLEESKEPTDGVEFLTSSRPYWSSSVYEGHLTWHLTLYYLELGDMESVLREYDDVLHDKATPDNYLGLLDASSLLWRLNVEGVDPGEERWTRVTDAMATRARNHRSPWVSAHIMMSLARGKVSEAAARLTLAEGMLQSMKEYCDDEGAFNQKLCLKLGVPVCNALLAFGKERYEEVLQIMLPLRHNLRWIGGSWAQRQVFNSTMIEAAVKADKLSIAIGLVAELLARKPQNKRLETLLQKLQSSLDSSHQPPAKKLKMQ